MTESRIKVNNEEKFDEREWLRREVLWASLMTPYGAQMAGWFNGTQINQHMGNFSRTTLYAENMHDLELQSRLFFNQGKNIGGIISSATLFRVNPTESDLKLLYEDGQLPTLKILEIQAKNVDIVLGNVAVKCIDIPGNDKDAYSECERISVRAYKLQNPFAQKRLLLRAGKIMSGLARKEAAKWREMAVQNEQHPLPMITIPDGGTPRSAGPRVEKLQPIFDDIVKSEQFRKL
jgi:hypothetical protein